MPDHIVENGECLWSLSMGSGHYWKTIWDDGANSDLKSRRKDPNVLAAGDKVHIPEIVEKNETGATEKRHRFRRKGIPVKFRIRMLHLGKPRKFEDFRLEIDGRIKKGKTDGDGWIEIPIPPDAQQGRLIMGDEEYQLDMGHLDPADSIKGAQQRLRNLGYYGGPIDGQESDLTTGALALFQREQGLETTGKLDSATQDALRKVHQA